MRMLKTEIRMATVGVIATLIGIIMCVVAAILYAEIGDNSMAFALGAKGVVLTLAFIWLSLKLRSLLEIKKDYHEED